jgi:predicted NAD/FAD-binding protein
MQGQTDPGLDIAVVGGGISGLVCAYLLAPVHSVTLFEARDRVGGHTHTVTVERPHGVYAIDTGFIVYNEPNYPGFTRLLARLGVASQPTSMSFSVRCDRTGTEYNGSSLNQVFAQRRNLLRPRFLGMVRDILRFNREAATLGDEVGETTTVAEWLASRDYGEAFVEHYLVPLGSSLWSSPPGTFRQFPIRFVVEFLANHAMLDLQGRPAWKVIEGGSRAYVEPLTRGFRDRIRLGTAVRRVTRDEEGVHIETATGPAKRFDEVIFACHSDQAFAMLGDASDLEAQVLAAVPYESNEVVLHTDTSVLPRRRRAWASWNYHVRADAPERATVTYDMNILQGLDAPETFCITLNETDALDPDKILGTWRYHHPVFGSRRAAAQRRHADLIRNRRTSYCGAWWGYGFHEDGVQSALRVCAAFGRSLAS